MESVALKARDHASGELVDVEHAGWAPPGSEAPMRFDVPIGHDLRLVGRGPALFAEDQRVLARVRRRRPDRLRGPPAQRAGREARTLASRRPPAHRAARRRRARPAHAAGRHQGGGEQPAPDRRDLVGRRAPTSCWRRSSDVGRPARRRRRQPARRRAACRPVRSACRPGRWRSTRSSARPLLACPRRRPRGGRRAPRTCRWCRPTPGCWSASLANLLDNALRHGGARPGGGTARSPAPRARRSRSSITGRACRRPARAALFEPFQRLDDRSRRRGRARTLGRARLRRGDGRRARRRPTRPAAG